jgi:hypothetical protein
MAEIKMPGGDSIEEFRDDCVTYQKAKERLKKLGVNTEQNAIIYLQREVDYYRDKIAHIEEKNRIRTGLLDEFQRMSIMPASEIGIKMPILESIPKDMRDRVASIEQTADGTVSVRFDKNDLER